jgi:tetratricopeptide (TPR) repeat protein
MEGKARIAVIAVGEAPMGLSYELEKRGIAVSSGDISSVEELVVDERPHLIALVGIRGAMEVSTLLEEQDRNTTPRVAVIAARRDLSRLWGLNRDVVVSLLATEMGDKVVAGRLEALARQAAKKRGEIIEGPAPTSLGPRSTTDAFTTVAPQAVAAIQLVKQAHQAGAMTVPAAVEINAMNQREVPVDEIDSADLESDRPPPEAPLPSASLLVTHLGLGLRPLEATAKGPTDAEAKPAPTETASAAFDPDTTSTYDRAPTNREADAPVSKEELAADAATQPPPPETTRQTISAEAPTSTDAEGKPDAESGDEALDEPFIDTEALVESLRASEPAHAVPDEGAAKLDKFEAVPADPGGVDYEPDSGELTRPGKTVLGLGVRNPVLSAKDAAADERLTIPGDSAAQSALAAEDSNRGNEARFFGAEGSEVTPPSGTSAAPPLRRSGRPSTFPPSPPDRRVPAVLLGLLAVAAAGGVYMNAKRQDAKEPPKISAVSGHDAATPPAPPASALAPSKAEPSEAVPPANETASEASTEKSNAEQPGSEKPSVADETTTPVATTPVATSGAAPGALSDALLERYLKVREVTPKTCSELVPSPKQGVRDPAAEGSVPWQAARKAIVRGDLVLAQTNMCEASFINPASPALEALALLYVTQGSPSEALLWLDKADIVRPGVRDTLDLRGTALSQLGQIEKARQIWLRALNIKDADEGRRAGVAEEDVAVARQHLKQGDLPRAERRLRRAVVLSPKSSIAMAALAEVFVKKAELPSAQGLAENAIVAEPFFPDAYVVLADIARVQGNTDKAREHLARALQIRPDFWAAKKALRDLDAPKP